MLSRLKILLFVPLFLLCRTAVHAQETDYMKHGKVFDLCSFKKECSDCFDCSKQKYLVKIKNKIDKKIKKVSYVFYSEVYNQVLTKDAKIEGSVIDYQQIGFMHICVPDGRHWAISVIEYADGSKNTFKVNDRLSTFWQEPDECECND